MTADRSKRLTAADTDRIQTSIDVAATALRAGVPVGPAEEEVLQRIWQQRKRLERREQGHAQARALRAHALHGSESLSDQVRATVETHPLYTAGVDFVRRHPISIGFALGAALAFGPRRLVRTAVWAAPLVARGWSLVERTSLLSTRRR